MLVVSEHLCADPGKVWKPKEEEKIQINEDDKVETEWDEVLAQATEEELVDLAGIYLFHLYWCCYS